MKKIKTRKRAVSGSGFNPEMNIISLYMREIAKVPLLNREEEENLARLSAAGDAVAREGW